MRSKIASSPPQNKDKLIPDVSQRTDEISVRDFIKDRFVTIWSSDKLDASFEDYLPVEIKRQNLSGLVPSKL